MPYVTDAQALLWFLTNDDRLWQIVKESSWLQIVPLDLLVLDKFLNLPRKLEMHDRVIAATSLLIDAPLLTLDPEIKKIAKIKTVW